MGISATSSSGDAFNTGCWGRGLTLEAGAVCEDGIRGQAMGRANAHKAQSQG